MVETDYYCLLHGLVLASEVDLPLPRITPSEPDVTYRLSLGKAVPPSFHSRSDDPDNPAVVEHWLGAQLAVEFPGVATFGLGRDRIELLRLETDDRSPLVRLLLDHVIPRVVALRGDLMLHAAGAVGPSGRAHLFLGEAGAGKSTVVTALVSSGWLLLDDDGIRVALLEGTFHAFPGAPEVRLLPDTAAALLPQRPPGEALAEESTKRRFGTDGLSLQAASAAAPIASLHLLARGKFDKPTTEVIGFPRGVNVISEHAFHVADEPSSIVRQAFDRASALAAAHPVRRLACPTGFAYLEGTKRLMSELDAGLDGSD